MIENLDMIWYDDIHRLGYWGWRHFWTTASICLGRCFVSSVTRIHACFWMVNIVYWRASPYALSHGCKHLCKKWVWVNMSQNRNPVDRVLIFVTTTIQLLEYPTLIQTWILLPFWSSQKGAGFSETNVYPILPQKPSHGRTKANHPHQRLP